uniref:Nematode cuticle collagen N-terminal domain-containing protein n=1 Tax=Globodera rostochiensis TaxID=31243 RepID=A0A914HV14_GLORO
MSETKIIIGIASLCSIAAILATLVVVPQLYQQINEVNSRVFDGVQAFRVNTDSAWTELMDVQISVTPPSRPRENPFNSIFMRQKRSGGLPSQCVCQLQQPHPEDLDSPEAPDNLANSLPHALLLPPHAPLALLVSLDSQEARDRLGPLEAMANPDSLDKAAVRDHPVRPDLRGLEETLDSLEDLVSQDSQELPEQKALHRPVPPDPLDNQEETDSPVVLVNPDSPEDRDLPDLLVSQEDLDSQEALDSPETRAHLASLATTVLTVLVHLAPAFSLVEAVSKCD